MPQKIDFWGTDPWGPYVVYTLMTLAALLLAMRLVFISRRWRQGQRISSRNNLLQGITQVFSFGILQMRNFRWRRAGLLHFLVSLSFLIFFLGTVFGTINSHLFRFLEGLPYLFYKLTLDIFTLIFLGAMAATAYRRFFQKPARLSYEPGFTISLLWLTLIVLSGLLVESLRLAIQQPMWAAWSPAGWALATFWVSLNPTPGLLIQIYQVVYLAHVTGVAALLVYLPSLPIIHTFTALLQVFNGSPHYETLQGVTKTSEGQWVFARTAHELTWLQLMQKDACTHCGRCQESCPAYLSGSGLNPKQVVLSLQGSLALISIPSVHENHENEQTKGTSEKTLWACSACGACVEACPILINPMQSIIDLRRALVEDGRIDSSLQTSLENLRNTGNAFGKHPAVRARWTDTIPRIKDARQEAVDYLWIIGDTASFHPELLETTRTLARLLQMAGLDFGILYDSEVNTGTDARRAGEEGLFEWLKQANQETIKKCAYKTLITSDPHVLHALKQEMDISHPGKDILHTTELLEKLLNGGQLIIKRRLSYCVTYHDPCYLARFNQIIDAPRRLLRAIGCNLVEMPRYGKNTFCCGAGGGRLWMEEGRIVERPAVMRLREATSLPQVTHFVTACPKDMLMFRDASQELNSSTSLVIRDIAEFVYEACH